MVNNPKGNCRYVGEPSTMYRVEAPISFKCKSYKNTETCVQNPSGPDAGGTTCTTTSECVEYLPPSCDETCIPCFNQVVENNVGISKGCIVCTRPECPDEIEARLATQCPIYFEGMPLGMGDKCSTSQRCPKQAVNPKTGALTDVTIRTTSCQPPELPKPKEFTVRDCPWKVDKRSQTGCEPIDPDNRNP